MPALSLGIFLFPFSLPERTNRIPGFAFLDIEGDFSLFNITNIKSKVNPMFCYPIDKNINRLLSHKAFALHNYNLIFIYRQDVGILFRPVKFSVLLTYKINQCSVTRSSKNGRF